MHGWEMPRCGYLKWEVSPHHRECDLSGTAHSRHEDDALSIDRRTVPPHRTAQVTARFACRPTVCLHPQSSAAAAAPGWLHRAHPRRDMACSALYRQTKLGLSLVDALDQLVEEGKLPPQLALRILDEV